MTSSAISTQTSDQTRLLFFKRSGAMSEYLPVCSGSEARADAAEHRRARSASLLWFLLQWYSLTSCERLPSSLSYSHWCLSFEPANANSPNISTPWPPATAPSACQSGSSSCVLHPRPLTLLVHLPAAKKWAVLPSSPPLLPWTCHWEIRSRVPAWGGRGTQRLNSGEVCVHVWPKFQDFAWSPSCAERPRRWR